MYIFYTLSCSFRLIEQTGVDFCAVQIIIISRAACRTQVFFCQYRAKFSNRVLLGTAVQPSCTVKALPAPLYGAGRRASFYTAKGAPSLLRKGGLLKCFYFEKEVGVEIL